MRIVVVGATGNVGSAVLRRLRREPDVEITGVARRMPARGAGFESVTWRRLDVGRPDAVDRLSVEFSGAQAVIHLAWQIQPSHDRARLRRTNVDGTAHVAEAAVRAGVPALVVASSVGAYAPAAKEPAVDESWPATGVAGSGYSEDKAAVEAMLDELEHAYPALRVVRMRPGLTFQRRAASEIARYFIGPFAPLWPLRAGRLPALPAHAQLRLQAVHADDVAEAYARAALGDAHGAFNIAADPPLDADSVRQRFGGVKIPISPSLLRPLASLTWHARLHPTEPGWIKLAALSPLMRTDRARAELGWRPTVTALDALAELFDGMSHAAGDASAPLRRRTPPAKRLAGLATGHLPGHGDLY